MIQLLVEPLVQQWPQLLQRPVPAEEDINRTVSAILQDVQQNGDEALRRYTEQFDKRFLSSFKVPQEVIANAAAGIDESLKAAIQLARQNIECFHRSQLMQEDTISTQPGVDCWRKAVPVSKVGLYIPGGTAPLFSTLLMLGIPAKLAGCREIVVCSPVGEDGYPHPAILYVADLLGIDKVFAVGGAQAIAAMAYGTATIPQVYKIFGPGNNYVTTAKRLVSMQDTAIDMPAGPSELAVYADATADAAFVAADLLSQAEHGADSQVLLVTPSTEFARKVAEVVQEQLTQLPRKEIAEKAMANSWAVVLEDTDRAFDLLNAYAPEHLIIAAADAGYLSGKVENAGSVFLGHYTPESAGDYASGTNHTLPTGGYAKAMSGVSMDSFLKKISFQQISKDGLQLIGDAIQQMARAEGLDGHARAVAIRLNNTKSLL